MGGDAKYGRLYTEADLERILEIADASSVQQLPSLHELVSDAERAPGGLTFPVDEPLFLLRGQDAAAADTVWAYAWEAQEKGESVTAVTDILKASNDIRDWQREHPDRIKVPD